MKADINSPSSDAGPRVVIVDPWWHRASGKPLRSWWLIFFVGWALGWAGLHASLRGWQSLAATSSPPVVAVSDEGPASGTDLYLPPLPEPAAVSTAEPSGPLFTPEELAAADADASRDLSPPPLVEQVVPEPAVAPASAPAALPMPSLPVAAAASRDDSRAAFRKTLEALRLLNQ